MPRGRWRGARGRRDGWEKFFPPANAFRVPPGLV